MDNDVLYYRFLDELRRGVTTDISAQIIDSYLAKELAIALNKGCIYWQKSDVYTFTNRTNEDVDKAEQQKEMCTVIR